MLIWRPTTRGTGNRADAKRGRRLAGRPLATAALCLSVLALASTGGAATAARAQDTIPIERLNLGEVEGPQFETLGRLQVAPVVVDGELLFNVVGIASYPADKRAAVIVGRIEALAEDDSYDPERLHIVAGESYSEILKDETTQQPPVVVIHDEDAALEGIGRDIVAATFKNQIGEAILDYRRDRDPEVILVQVGHAAVRTLALVLILFAVIWGFRRLHAVLESRFTRYIKRLEAKSMRMIQAEQIWAVVSAGLRLLRIVLVLVLVYVFVNFVLDLFPWTRYASRTLLQYIVSPLRGMADAVIDYVPSLIYLILLFLITRYLLKVMRGFFIAIGRGVVQLANFEAEWAIPTYRIVRVLVIVFALVLAYPYIPGSDSEAFKGVSILLGVLFSLGSTSMISHVIAGYAMTYRRAFRIGDRVRIGDVVGDVTDRRMLVTHVRTLKNEEVVIPNSNIMNTEVTNYTSLVADHGLILHSTVGIGYEVPWRQVEAMLLVAAERTEGLMKEPRPFVLQKSLADFAVNYELNAYCDNEKRAPALYSGLHRNIQDVFNEYGVQIMTPAYESDTPEPKIVPRNQWYAAPAEPPGDGAEAPTGPSSTGRSDRA